MENEEKKQSVVIKRIKRIKKSGHHGGSWKIAYADFITAMMAFFLLMWLLSLLNKYQLEGMAEYFKNPLEKALPNPGNQRNKDKHNDKFTEKEKEKFKEKEKEKPNKVDIKQIQGKQALTPEQKAAQVQAMKNDLMQKIEKNPQLRQFKNQLNFIVTADGLKIQLHDLENKSMFTTGKADFENYSKTIISWLGQELNNYPNQIVIIGHTDSALYKGDQYTNWELSADRANATRRALIKYGMNQEKILRIIGVGDNDLLDKNNKLNPANRRIEILILSDDSLKKLEHK